MNVSGGGGDSEPEGVVSFGSNMTVYDKVLKYEADGDPHKVHVNDMALDESYGNHCGPKVKPLYGDDYGKGKNFTQCRV